MNRNKFIKNAEACQRELLRFLTALCCGNTAMAEDIAQETLIKAYISIDSLKDETRFKAWIFRIAHTTALNQMRSLRPRSDAEVLKYEVSPETTDASFRYQDLYVALDQLSPTERYSILLFYMEGYTVKEISEATGTSESAIKQHLSRGRNHLRSLLSSSTSS